MALDITMVITDRVAEITLAGELYSGEASDRFQRELDNLLAAKPSRLVLHVRDLAYIASIFLRMLLVAQRQLGSGLSVYVVAPQEQVLDTLKRAGLHTSVVVVNDYPPTE